MTPFDSWLWHAWLPRVRSAINNEWAVEVPQPVIRLYEVWANFLPGFIRDNFFDQLVLPKLQKAIADWSPRKSNAPLHSLIFPWLPHVGLRVEEVLGDARRKLKSQMRGWTPSDGIPLDFLVWKDVRCVILSHWRKLISSTHLIPLTGSQSLRMGQPVIEVRCSETRGDSSGRLPGESCTTRPQAAPRRPRMG